MYAIGATDIRLVQVKGGTRPYLPTDERIEIAAMPVPTQAVKECWRFYRGRSAPDIERIE